MASYSDEIQVDSVRIQFLDADRLEQYERRDDIRIIRETDKSSKEYLMVQIGHRAKIDEELKNFRWLVDSSKNGIAALQSSKAKIVIKYDDKDRKQRNFFADLENSLEKRRADTRPPTGIRNESPTRCHDSPPARRRESPPPRSSIKPTPPGRPDESSPARRRESPPPRRRESPPARRKESPPPPPRSSIKPTPPGRPDESSPARRRESPPPRRRESPPPRRNESPSTRRREPSPGRDKQWTGDDLMNAIDRGSRKDAESAAAFLARSRADVPFELNLGQDKMKTRPKPNALQLQLRIEHHDCRDSVNKTIYVPRSMKLESLKEQIEKEANIRCEDQFWFAQEKYIIQDDYVFGSDEPVVRAFRTTSTEKGRSEQAPSIKTGDTLVLYVASLPRMKC